MSSNRNWKSSVAAKIETNWNWREFGLGFHVTSFGAHKFDPSHMWAIRVELAWLMVFITVEKPR